MPDWPEQRDYSALVLAGQAVTGSVGTHACFSSVTCLTPLSLWCCPIPALRFACFIDVCAVCRAVPRRLSSGVCAMCEFLPRICVLSPHVAASPHNAWMQPRLAITLWFLCSPRRGCGSQRDATIVSSPACHS